MNQDQAIKEKIQKLLGLSKSPNENEAEQASRKVQELLILHNLTIEDVENSINDVMEELVFEVTRAVKWKMFLLSSVADFYDCETLILRTRHKQSSNTVRVSIVGSQSNVTVALLMLNYFMLAIDRVAREDRAEGISTTATYRFGVALSIGQKLADRKTRIQEDGFTSDSGKIVEGLVLQSQAQKASNNISRYLDSTYPKIKTVAVKSSGDKSKLNSGYTAGERIGIDTQLEPELEQLPGSR